MIEYSHNGEDWVTTAYPGWKYRRETEDLPEELPKLEVEKYIKARQGYKIEFSYDGGYSYTTFRIKNITEDAGRIVTLLKMHRKVRFIKVEDASTVVSPSQFRSTNKPVRVMKKYKYIFKKNDGSGWFATEDKPGSSSCIVQTIPMTMAEPNSNEVSAGYASINDPIIRGHIYKIYYIDSTDGMDEATVKYFEDQTFTSITEYCLVETPRSYDAETNEAIGGTFVCSVLASTSNRYYVHSRNNPYKIGDTFFVKKAAVMDMAKALNDYGATVIYQSRNDLAASQKQTEIVDVIMDLDTKLKEAIDSNDSRHLTVALYEAVRLRDDTVGALEHLVETIQMARQKVREMVEHPE